MNRPAADVPAGDPAVVRSERIAASPQSSAHGADGLASGSVSDCGAGLEDAQAGGACGACGSVRWCVGSGCESVSGQANTGFVNATTRLNMAMELGGEEFDREDLRFFKGKRRACHIKWFGLANCCKNSGALVGLADCSAEEQELAKERNGGNTHYLGKYCSRRTFFGACIRRSRAWCVFGSKLGRNLQELGDGRMLDLQQGDAQLRHVDRAWASTVHAFQGRTVDTVIAAMEANHPNLTTQKTFYVEISRARDKAELVTDDKAALREQLEAATGERIAALEAVEPEKAKGREGAPETGRSAEREGEGSPSQDRERSLEPAMEQSRAPKSPDRDLGL